MHLAQGIGTKRLTTPYHKTHVLTRPDTLPYLFRKLRIHRNLTRSSLAEIISFSERYIYDVEGGYRFPSLNYCLRCANLFGANAQWVNVCWAREAVRRYQERINRRLALEPWGEQK